MEMPNGDATDVKCVWCIASHCCSYRAPSGWCKTKGVPSQIHCAVVELRPCDAPTFVQLSIFLIAEPADILHLLMQDWFREKPWRCQMVMQRTSSACGALHRIAAPIARRLVGARRKECRPKSTAPSLSFVLVTLRHSCSSPYS
eukprot:Polyplicarium_translucidae@DN2480_c0_g1_i1.p1